MFKNLTTDRKIRAFKAAIVVNQFCWGFVVSNLLDDYKKLNSKNKELWTVLNIVLNNADLSNPELRTQLNEFMVFRDIMKTSDLYE